MLRKMVLLSLLCAAAATGLGGLGCVEEPDCRAACEHTCDLCGTGCEPDEIDTCTQSCEDGLTDPARTDCVLSTDRCEDLWKC